MGEDQCSDRIKSFTGLYAWQEGHKLVLVIYKETAKFPKEEKYSLTDQIRRAAISVTSNIAEGFSRYGKSEKKQFYRMALGSLTELQNQLLIARDINYLTKDKFDELAGKTIIASKLINGLIKSVSLKPLIPNT